VDLRAKQQFKLRPQDLGQKLATCLHTSVAVLQPSNPAHVRSPDFADSDNNTVSNSVAYHADPATADKEFAVFQQSNFPSCAEAAMKAAIADAILHPKNPSDTLPSGATIGDPTVKQLSFPTVGDKTVAYQVAIPIQYSGLTITLYADLVFMQKGRALASMNYEAASSPFDSTQEEQLATLTAGRLAST
jgi:hypothetical protein